MPYSHNVLSSEERTSLGFPSSAWSKDCFKIMAEKVSPRFPGEGAIISFVLPTLSRDCTKAWTKSTLLHPYHLDKAGGGVAGTFYGTVELTTVEIWNIARIDGSAYPPKNFEQSRLVRAGREEWMGIVRPQKELDQETTLKNVAKKQQNQEDPEPKPLAPMKKRSGRIF